MAVSGMEAAPRHHLLLEIGCEELPARFMPGALRQLEEAARAGLEALRLGHGPVRTVGTPRRLALLVEGLAPQQEEQVLEAKGPSARVAFDAEGRPTKAAEGFARSQGVPVEALEVRETPQGPYVFAVRREPGRPAADVLAEWLPGLVGRLQFPKSMRWTSTPIRFARPIRWLVALLDGEVIPFERDGLASSRHSRGHRLLAPGPVEIPHASLYIQRLREAAVVVDPEERRRLIWEQAQAVAAGLGGRVEDNPELLEEVVHLVENPSVLGGRFNPDDLQLPPEVLVTAMESHQRYFPVVGPGGQLLPYFIVVSNGDPARGETIIKGHERVLAARLADARFFYEEDRRVPLADQFPGLGRVVFQESLGTLEEKARRIEQLSGYLADALGLGAQERAWAQRAAFLAKVDLVTKMVYEFPELQGIMGREYARASGEEEPVAVAVFEHTLPRHAGDRLPGTRPGAVVAVADRLDTLAGYLAIGKAPTGSQDPYGLRRAANGAVLVWLEHGFPLSLTAAVEQAVAGYGKLWANPAGGGAGGAVVDQAAVVGQVAAFLRQRLRAILLEEGLRYDLVDAALGALPDDLVGAARRARWLQGQVGSPVMAEALRVYQRVANLARQGEGLAVEVDVARFAHGSEGALWQALQGAEGGVEAALAQGDADAALQALAGLGPAVDAFFDGVLVMDPDPAVRSNRLALLVRVRDLFHRLADWSRVEG